MRTIVNLFAIFAISVLAGKSFAGPGISGGGDQCENRIQAIAQDIQVWIRDGGHKALDFPGGLQPDQYAYAMAEGLAKANVTCVGKGDPVQILGTPKVCRFDRGGNDARITCDYEKFSQLSDDDQYVLIHHEYAGLAGLEPAAGDRSQYTISNQITGYLQDTIVRKLAVKPAFDEKKICAKGIREFVGRKFPFEMSEGKRLTLKSVELDKVQYLDSSGEVEIEVHAVFDDEGYIATRIFIGSESVWKRHADKDMEFVGCKNFNVKASYPDSIGAE